MRKGFLRSVAALLAGSGLALAETPPARVPAGLGTEPPLFNAVQAPGQPGKGAAGAQPVKPGTAVPVKPGVAAPVYPPGKPGPVAPGPVGDKHAATACCDPCLPKYLDVCGPPGKCWVSAEYLLWWVRPQPSPALVTTSPASSLGILGQPGTQTLIGGNLDDDPLHGVRVTAGTWLDCQQKKGVEIGGFIFFDRDSRASAGAPGTAGTPTIARPFFNVLTGREDSQLVAFPGVLAGTATVDSSTRLLGLTPNFICNLCCSCPTDCCNPTGYRVDLLVGPRFYQLEEDLTIREDLLVAPGVPVLGGSRIRIRDTFDTTNRFYGGFIGARAEYWRDRFFVNATGGIALGNNHQIVRIGGTTTIAPPTGAVVNRAGGLLTQPTNSGRFSRNEFSVVPEVGFNVGYQVTDNLRAFVGYSLLYWTEVVRPGDQIDRGINTTQLPTLGGTGSLTGPARPAFSFRDADFWAQGINVGVQVRY